MEHLPGRPTCSAVGLLLTWLCIGCGGGSSSPADAGIDAGQDAGIDAGPDANGRYAELAAIIEAERQELRATGVAVAVIEDGELTYSAGFGLKHVDRADPILTTTRFRIASFTKPLTALGVLRLVDQGSVNLDAPVVDYAPQLHLTRSAALLPSLHVRHLLTQSSGFPDEGVMGTWPNSDDAELDTYLTSQAFADRYSLMFPPGRMFFYSNIGFDLAGLVIERASGQMYPDYMRDHVFAPLGMTRATFRSAEVVADGDFAYGTRFGLVAVDPIQNPPPWQAPCGLAFASVLDLAAFAGFLMDGDEAVLSSALHAAMVSPQLNIEVLQDRIAQGLGVVVYRGYPTHSGVLDYDFTTLEHGGRMMGNTIRVIVVPERRFGFVMITNTEDAYFDRSSVAALTLVEGVPEAPLVQAPEDPQMFGRYAGTYQSDTGFPTGSGEVTVSVDASGLQMTVPPGVGTGILTPVHERNFACAGDGPLFLSTFTFLLDPSENVEYLRTWCLGFVARRQ